MSHEDMFDWDSYLNTRSSMNVRSIDDQFALISGEATPGDGQQIYQESIVPGTDDARMLGGAYSDANSDHPVPSRFPESMHLVPLSTNYRQQSSAFDQYQITPYGYDSIMCSYPPGPTDFSYFAEPPYTNSISSSARTSVTLSSTDRQHGEISSTAKPVERSRSPISDVTRSKGRGNRLGQTHSAETRAKIAAYGRGRTRSAATGAKIAAAQSLLFHVKRLHEQNFTFAGKSVSSVEVPTFQAVHDLTGYGRKAIRSAIKDRNGVVGGKWVVTCLGTIAARDGSIQNLLRKFDIAQAESTQPRSLHDRSLHVYDCMPNQTSQVQGSGWSENDWYQLPDVSYLHTITHTASSENGFGTPHLRDLAHGFEGSDTTDTVANRDEPVVPPKSRRPLQSSEVTRVKSRVASSNRAPISEATESKMREAALSRPRRPPTSEATKAKLRAAALKRAPPSEASRSRMREAAFNRPPSAPVTKATRAKLRAAALKRAAASKAS